MASETVARILAAEQQAQEQVCAAREQAEAELASAKNHADTILADGRQRAEQASADLLEENRKAVASVYAAACEEAAAKVAQVEALAEKNRQKGIDLVLSLLIPQQ